MPKPRWGAKKQLTNNLQVVPNVAADVTTKDTYLRQIHISNVGATAATITIKDKQSTPRTVVNALSVDPNTAVIMVWPEGIELKSGLNWVSDTSNALNAALEGEYLP